MLCRLVHAFFHINCLGRKYALNYRRMIEYGELSNFTSGQRYYAAFNGSYAGGLSCVDEVNVQQPGMFVFDDGIRVIVPRINFSCNGRITGYLISLERLSGGGRNELPIIQVYRPTIGSLFNEKDHYTLNRDEITNMGDYYLANVSFTNNDRIEFQSDDVIGYYIPDGSRYNVWNIETEGYTSYIDEDDRESFSINSETDSTEDNRQPLILVIFGKAYIKFKLFSV